MKRILIILLFAALLLGNSSCAKNGKTPENSPPPDTSTANPQVPSPSPSPSPTPTPSPSPTPEPSPEPSPEPTPEPSPEPTPTPPIPEYPAIPIRPDIDPSRPMIALTFDDGPGVHTQRVLDTLERYSAVATFCQIGRQIAGYAELDRAIVAQGSQIISHTWDHWNLTKHTDDEIRWQLETVNNALADIGVPTSRFFRPPYGSISADVQRVAAELGLTAINWNVDPRDWDHKDAQQTYDRIMDKVKDGAIILCHDIYGETADAMERVIPELIARGYQLVTIAELLEYRGIEIVAGGVIYHG